MKPNIIDAEKYFSNFTNRAEKLMKFATYFI